MEIREWRKIRWQMRERKRECRKVLDSTNKREKKLSHMNGAANHSKFTLKSLFNTIFVPINPLKCALFLLERIDLSCMQSIQRLWNNCTEIPLSLCEICWYKCKSMWISVRKRNAKLKKWDTQIRRREKERARETKKQEREREKIGKRKK